MSGRSCAPEILAELNALSGESFGRQRTQDKDNITGCVGDLPPEVWGQVVLACAGNAPDLCAMASTCTFFRELTNSALGQLKEKWETDSALVIVNGSGWTKAGFSRATEPRVIIPTAVAVNASDKLQRKVMCGHAACFSDSTRRPIASGLIVDFDAMEQLWSHVFYNELSISPEDRPVLLTEPPLNPKANREKMRSIMFETFSVPALYVVTDALLALYATDRTTGVVLDAGQSVTHAVPIYEGYVLPHAIQRLALGGNDLTMGGMVAAAKPER